MTITNGMPGPVQTVPGTIYLSVVACLNTTCQTGGNSDATGLLSVVVPITGRP